MKRFREFVNLFYMLVYFTTPGMAQSDNYNSAQIGFHFDYFKSNIGAGIEGGYKVNNSYIGLNTLFHFNRKRDVPTFVNMQYGYYVGGFMPFVLGGYYTAGGEAVREKEGKQGMEYGAGLSYQFNDSPVKLSVQISNVKTCYSIGLVKDL